MKVYLVNKDEWVADRIGGSIERSIDSVWKTRKQAQKRSEAISSRTVTGVVLVYFVQGLSLKKKIQKKLST
jgi:hypothetical protein